MSYRAAVECALQRTIDQRVEAAWSDALNASRLVELSDREGLIRELRTVESRALVASVYETIASPGPVHRFRSRAVSLLGSYALASP